MSNHCSPFEFRRTKWRSQEQKLIFLCWPQVHRNHRKWAKNLQFVPLRPNWNHLNNVRTILSSTDRRTASRRWYRSTNTIKIAMNAEVAVRHRMAWSIAVQRRNTRPGHITSISDAKSDKLRIYLCLFLPFSSFIVEKLLVSFVIHLMFVHDCRSCIFLIYQLYCCNFIETPGIKIKTHFTLFLLI